MNSARIDTSWIAEYGQWNDATFGAHRPGSPSAAHLIKEAAEARDNPGDITEWADCLLLTIDGARRSGFSIEALFTAARWKFGVLKIRKWGKPNADGSVQHIPEGHLPLGLYLTRDGMPVRITEVDSTTGELHGRYVIGKSRGQATRWCPDGRCSKGGEGPGDLVELLRPDTEEVADKKTIGLPPLTAAGHLPFGTYRTRHGYVVTVTDFDPDVDEMFQLIGRDAQGNGLFWYSHGTYWRHKRNDWDIVELIELAPPAGDEP